MKEAMFYRIVGEKVQCTLCPHYCMIENQEYGKCHVRYHHEGKLYTLNYGKIIARAKDPIEKKPLYHFYPGRMIDSVATFGCNMRCQFCQNYQLSQKLYDLEETPVQDLVESLDGLGIAFTYNEPMIWYEYVYETAKYIKTHKPGMQVVLITNGFINEEPLKMLLPYVDALNVDLKSYSEDFYREICGGRLEPVLKTLALASEKHLEVTTLMVTDHVDIKQVEEIARYIGNLSEKIPLHLSRYYPSYQLQLPPTDETVMHEAKRFAEKYLKYVYLGNLQDTNNNTNCGYCGAVLVKRQGYFTTVYVDDDRCPVCGRTHDLIGYERKLKDGYSKGDIE